MYYIAWNGEIWSAPFRPCDLVECRCGGLNDKDGTSICWDADGFRGENWLRLDEWSEEKMKQIESANRDINV